MLTLTSKHASRRDVDVGSYLRFSSHLNFFYASDPRAKRRGKDSETEKGAFTFIIPNRLGYLMKCRAQRVCFESIRVSSQGVGWNLLEVELIWVQHLTECNPHILDSSCFMLYQFSAL